MTIKPSGLVEDLSFYPIISLVLNFKTNNDYKIKPILSYLG